MTLDDLAMVLCVEAGEPESCAKFYRDSVKALITTIEQAGYKIVPVEATEGMIDAGRAILNDPDITRSDGSIHVVEGDEMAIWQAMISASPKIGEE